MSVPYPTGYTVAPGSVVRRVLQKTAELAEDGTPRSQLIASDPAYQLKLVHEYLSDSDMATLRSFYTTNTDAVAVPWPDGKTYTGFFTAWEQKRIGPRWVVTLELTGGI